MFDGLTLKQLRSLRIVAETGSLTSAATSQLRSLPAIHSQIKKLESLIGEAVLTRDAEDRSFVATPQGAVLIAAAERIEGVLAWARDNLDALGRGNAGHVRIGFESTGRYFAPRLVARLKQRCPNIGISFVVANRTHMIESLAKERIDLAVMGRPPRESATEAIPIGEHPYALFVPPEHELARKRDYDPETLLRQPILAREPGSGTRILLDRYLNQIEDYGTPSVVEMDSNETIKEAIIAGLGVGMLSMHVVQRELADRCLARLEWPRLPIMRYWYLVSNRSAHVAETTLRVRQSILDENGAFLPRTIPGCRRTVSPSSACAAGSRCPDRTP